MANPVRDIAQVTLSVASGLATVATAGTVAATISGLAILPFDPAWTAPTPWAWGVLAVCAACVFVATTFMTTGLRTGEIAVVAPFRYAPVVPVSLLLGNCARRLL